MLVCTSLLLNSMTWHIKLDGSGDFTAIQEGIDASTDSDTVLVYPGTYYENINFNGKNITVASLEMTTNDPQYIYQTIIDGQRLTSCVSIVSEETYTCLRGLTITNGQGEMINPNKGGGISIFGNSNILVQCDIINCFITNNYSMNAAGLNIKDGLVFMSGNSITSNFAQKFGGGLGIRDHSQVIFDSNNRCKIYNNFAGYSLEMFVETIYFDEFSVIVDSFTVAEPGAYFAQAFPNNENFTFVFDILNPFIEPIDNDLYVSPMGDDSNSGLDSGHPLKTINLAVRNIASNPENPHTIHLAEGTYNHTDNQQLFPFGCKSYVNIIGEDMETTIIDGELENHPFFITGSDYSNSRIKNLTFQNGFYHQSLLMTYYSDSIKFENLIIRNLTITNSGAGINSSGSGGNIQLENVTIDNISVSDGPTAGAWFNETASFKASNCTFSNNSCTGSTGLSAGLYVMSNGDIVIDNCKFINNSATSTTWTGYASALLCTDYNDIMGDTYINNCLFSGNSNYGGKSTVYAQSLVDGVVHFTNNTIVDNQNQYGIEFQGNIKFTNNILRNDTYDEILLNIIDPGVYSTLDVSYSNIDGGINAIHNAYNVNTINWLDGNIDEAPLFLMSGDDPYQLSEFSPCIDSGTPDTTGLFIPPWDVLHNQRVWDGNGNGVATIDIGCYEFGAPQFVDTEENEIPVSSFDKSNLTNYPNPFNPSTTIKLELAEAGKIELIIYNIKGQKVKTLLDCTTAPGTYECNWNGKDETGNSVSSGQYIVKLKQNEKETATKIMLLK